MATSLKRKLDDPVHFPAYKDLPNAKNLVGNYYKKTPLTIDGVIPIRNWMYIADIALYLPIGGNTTTLVCEDRDGEPSRMWFDTLLRPEDMKLMNKYSDKNPLVAAVLYPETKDFQAEGKDITCITSEEQKYIKIFPGNREMLANEVELLTDVKDKDCVVCDTKTIDKSKYPTKNGEVECHCPICEFMEQKKAAKGASSASPAKEKKSENGAGGGGKKCAKCKVAKYCGVDCQKAHWENGHRKLCAYANLMTFIGQHDFSDYKHHEDWNFYGMAAAHDATGMPRFHFQL